MKWPNDLLIMRHGQSVRNVLKDVSRNDPTGRTEWCNDGIRDQDTILTEIGQEQAYATGKVLNLFYAFSTNPISTIFVSPYQRTRETAEFVQSALKYAPKLVVEERIREIEFGILDGLTSKGIAEKYPDELIRKQREGKYYYRPPGGESRPDVALRCHSFLDTLVRDYSGERILLICHSVVVLVLRRLLERWEEEDYLQVDREQDVQYASVTSYTCINNKIKLQEFNKVYY